MTCCNSKRKSGSKKTIIKKQKTDANIIEDLKIIRPLGTGAEGSVSLISVGGKLCVLKKNTTKKSSANEIELLKTIHKNPENQTHNVVKFIERINNFNFIMNYPGSVIINEVLRTYSTEDLFIYIQKHNGVEGEELMRLAGDITNGVNSMHTAEVVHMDIKPENIVVTLNTDGSIMKATIVDLGLGMMFDDTLFNIRGSLPYLCPEMLVGVKTASPASDLWSTAVTLMVANTCRLPFSEASCRSSHFYNLFNLSEDKRFAQYSPFIVRYLKQMLRINPIERQLYTGEYY